MWGDKYQIIVVTHLDRGHLHNHFCFNSVSYLDGSKYNYSKSEQKRLRETSDRLCREYGLSVIENPKKAPSRPLYLDEKSGKPTRYNVYLEDLAEAISGSRDIPHMMKYLIDKGYEVDFSGGHWKMKLPQYKHFTRLDTLDERLTPDFIRSHLGTRARYGNYKAKISYSPHMPEEYKKAWKPHQKTRGILALYYYWCYQLGIFPKGTDYKPTSPLMKEELRKLDEITTQVRYMSEHNISTLSDLHADREKNQELADFLIAYYQIPEEFCAETRYYYDMVDLNEDGTEEILAVVVGEYTECDGGDPAVILEQSEQGYQVLESFAYVRTPVYVSDTMTDGWHDLIFPAYGGEEGTGFRVFHYQDGIGYQNENMEFMEDMDENFCGKKMIADNFIDDMDKGNYLTLRETPLSGN